jgi:octaprenyl-diphosphate synthase
METVCGLGSLDLITGMARTIRKMSEGELKELQYAKGFHDDMEAYLDIIYLKTATLFEFCTHAPGLIAGLPQDSLNALTTFGKAVGMAFQIVDDIINLAPVKDDDKDPYNDILEGKSTLPLLYVFRQDPGILAGVSAMSDPEDKKKYLIPFITPEILRMSREVAGTYLDDAMQAIDAAGFITEDLARIPGPSWPAGQPVLTYGYRAPGH